MDAGQSDIEVLKSIPVRRESLEDIAQVVNILNDFLSPAGFFVDVVGDEENGYFALFKIPLGREMPFRPGP